MSPAAAPHGDGDGDGDGDGAGGSSRATLSALVWSLRVLEAAHAATPAAAHGRRCPVRAGLLERDGQSAAMLIALLDVAVDNRRRHLSRGGAAGKPSPEQGDGVGVPSAAVAVLVANLIGRCAANCDSTSYDALPLGAGGSGERLVRTLLDMTRCVHDGAERAACNALWMLCSRPAGCHGMVGLYRRGVRELLSVLLGGGCCDGCGAAADVCGCGGGAHGDASARVAAARALQCVLAEDEAIEEFESGLGGPCAALVGLARSAASLPELVAAVVGCVANLARSERLRDVLIAGGVVPALAAAAASRSAAVQHAVASATFACVTPGGAEAAEFQRLGGVAELVRALHSPSVDTARAAAVAIRALCVDYAVCRAVLDANGVRVLVRVLGDADEGIQTASAGALALIRSLGVGGAFLE